MAEYIEWEALQNLFNDVSTSLLSRGELAKDAEHMVRAFLMVTEMIQDAPAADVAPGRCGWWRPVHASEATGWDPKIAGRDPIWGYTCSECGTEAIYDCNDEYVLSDYCPNCGARMDGAE